MSKDNEDLEEKEEKEEEGVLPEKAPANKGKKVLLFLIPLLIIVIIGIIYGGMRFLTKSPVNVKKEDEKPQVVQGEYSFLDIDDIIVTLASTNSKRNFLKMSLSLQVKDKATVNIITTKLPIVRDSFQLFLREVRPSDLSGSAGILMLKNELLKRINKIVAPIEVMDVLFKEILVS